jgi:hypothetical protein
MDIQKRLLTLFLILVVSHVAYSNPKFFPGYYIELNGDSIVCKIEYLDWAMNPENVVVETSDGKRNFGASEIKGFGVFGYCDYRAATITYHKGFISGSILPEDFSDKVETKEYFLKTLVAGYYSLYELSLPERAYYFISENDGIISELVYRVKKNETHVIEDQQYKQTLFALLNKEGIQTDNFVIVNRALYNNSDIRPLIIKLNVKHTGINTVYARPKSKHIEFGVYVGGLLNSFPTAITGAYSKDNKVNSSVAATGGINFLYNLPFRFNSVAFGLSIGYLQYSFTINRAGTDSYYESANYNETITYSE